MNETASNNKKVIAALAVLLLVAVMVLGAKALAGKSEQPVEAGGAQPVTISESGSSQARQADTGDTAEQSTYKDGEYKAEGAYRSPGGQQSISISLTVQNGKVTATTADPGATDGTSGEYQSKFISGYRDQVVGKSLDEIRLDKVSCSSLTPQGFNDAIDKIKAEAKA